MTPEELGGRIAARFGAGAVSDVSHGVVTADVPAPRWAEALAFARDGLGCDTLDWLSALDELADGFAVLAHLRSRGGGRHLILRTRVGRRRPGLPTGAGVYAEAAGHERQTAALTDIRFEGHPDSPSLLSQESCEGASAR